MNEKTIENIENIVEMYRRKKSAKEIGKMYGISEQDTSSFLRSLKKIGAISVEDAKQRGNTRSVSRIKGTSDRNRQIVFDYENFVDMKKMEEKYGLLETSIKQILAKEGIQLNRRSYRNLKYPQNLIFDIFGRIDFEISEDTEIGLNYCLETLSEREQKVLAEYYEKENTFRGIAKIFSNSAERIRQIHAKALRELRNPRRSGYIEFGYKRYTEMIEKEKEEIQRKIENKKPAELKIEELNLSVRGYNCMKRAGISIVKRDGEPNADFINCIAFGKNGEFAEKYLHKSIKILIEGRIQTGSYTNKDGQKVYTNDCVVESCEFAESKNANQSERPQNAPQTDNPGDGFMSIPDNMDDLPFN